MSPLDNVAVEESRIGLANSGPITNAVMYNNGKDLGSALSAAGATLPGPPTGAAGGALTGTYPNPTLANNSVSSANIVDGSIGIDDLGTSARTWYSYFWFLTWGGSGPYQQRTTTFSVPTRSNCLFIISSTAFVVSAGGPYTMWSAIDGVTGWNQYSAYFHNTTGDHRTYPTGFQSVSLNAGTYTFRLYMPSGQYTDVNDFSIVSVIGTPY